MNISAILNIVSAIENIVSNIPLGHSDKKNIAATLEDVKTITADAENTVNGISQMDIQQAVAAILPGVVENAVSLAISKLMPVNAPSETANAGVGIGANNTGVS